jgi:Tol biopolymer transport system component
MNRLGFVLVLAAALLGLAVHVTAATPEGPRLAVLVDNLGDERGADIVTMDPAGGSQQALIRGADFARPSWSADGSLMTLGATGEWKGVVVAVAEADGSGLRFYRHAPLEGSDPVMAPDGRTVAYARVKLVKVLPGRENYFYKSSIWLLDIKTGGVRRGTPWRLQTGFEPSSFSPDGSKLAVTMFDRRGITAVAIDMRTGRTSPLAKEASAPAYSPDGSEVAFIRWKNWHASAVDGRVPVNELRVARVGGGKSRLLLHRHSLLDSPSWDPSGGRLAFIASHTSEYESFSPEEGDKLMEINADGSCLTRVFSRSNLIVSGPAWQPGPGREAGPISC